MLVLMASSAAAYATPHDDPCPVTSKGREWSAACFVDVDEGRQVKQEYRKKLVFDRKGRAAIVIASPPELVAVDRSGMLVPLTMDHLPGPRFDFEPGNGDGDIVRLFRLVGHEKKGRQFKCGYYRSGTFEVLVPPVYDQCDAFKHDTALVCIGCTSACNGGDCHQSDFVGGEALVINENNEVQRRFPLPKLPLCGVADEGIGEGANKKCRSRPFDPFAQLK